MAPSTIKVLEAVVTPQAFYQSQAGGFSVSPKEWNELPLHHQYGVLPDVYILFQDPIFEFTTNINEADIIPTLIVDSLSQKELDHLNDTFNDKQIAVNIKLVQHIDEECMNEDRRTSYLVGNNHPFKKIIDIHTDSTHVTHNTTTFLYTDYLFNRSHAMHFNNASLVENYGKTVRNHWWTANAVDSTNAVGTNAHENREDTFPFREFELTPDNKILTQLTEFERCMNGHEITPKMFVCPSITRIKPRLAQRSVLRKELNNVLYQYEGYIGDISQGLSMLPDKENYQMHDILGLNGWGFTPPHNLYYDTSVFSVYVESLIYQSDLKTMCATEKTFTPMCKGHFIMPFGTPYFVKHLKDDYGFKFPQWIDYTYDGVSAENLPFTEQIRWDTWIEEIKAVCSMGGKSLYQRKRDDINILLHNRSIMRDYGPRHDLSENIEYLMG